jgi:hypothetical protein
VVKLSEPQCALLAELRRRASADLNPEWFAPNMPVVRALARHGLVTARFIGQRWWAIQLTAAGRRFGHGG